MSQKIDEKFSCRWTGKGVSKAVSNVNDIIAPGLLVNNQPLSSLIKYFIIAKLKSFCQINESPQAEGVSLHSPSHKAKLNHSTG